MLLNGLLQCEQCRRALPARKARRRYRRVSSWREPSSALMGRLRPQRSQNPGLPSFGDCNHTFFNAISCPDRFGAAQQAPTISRDCEHSHHATPETRPVTLVADTQGSDQSGLHQHDQFVDLVGVRDVQRQPGGCNFPKEGYRHCSFNGSRRRSATGVPGTAATAPCREARKARREPVDLLPRGRMASGCDWHPEVL
jgi:hypothetical protein